MPAETQERWLIVGLGNPGRRYESTYHNLGRIASVRYASRIACRDPGWSRKFKGQLASLDEEGRRLFVLLPETFMNLSGESVATAKNWLGIELHRVIVIHDDLDLPPGAVRVKVGGGDGGHRGLLSCILQLGASDFVRVRIGIGRDEYMDPVDYVLSRVKSEHEPLLGQALDRAGQAVAAVLKNGVTAAMNEFNRREAQDPAP